MVKKACWCSRSTSRKPPACLRCAMRPSGIRKMNNLRAAFDHIDHLRKRQVHVSLCQYALDVWEAYAQQHAPIEYIDSIVGMCHRVDIALPHAAFASVQSSDRADVAQRYLEPIAALQDNDLVFPGSIEMAYYAIYNLYRKYIEGAAIDD